MDKKKNGGSRRARDPRHRGDDCDTEVIDEHFQL